MTVISLKNISIKKPALAVTKEASYYPVFTGGVDQAAIRLPSQLKHPPLNFIKEKTIALPVLVPGRQLYFIPFGTACQQHNGTILI